VNEDQSLVVNIGLDDGYAYTKLALPNGRVYAIPSCGRLGHVQMTWLDNRGRPVREYETTEQVYSVGDIDGESTLYTGYPFSGLNRAIVQHCLLEAGLGGHALHAVSGLPVSGFYAPGGELRTDVIARKIANLKSPVRPTDGRLPAEIAFHDVIPEAIAAWYDHMIEEDESGLVFDLARQNDPIAVIDIGGRTTDFVVVADQAVHHDSSGSLGCGILDAANEMRTAVCARFGLDEIGDSTIRSAAKTGKIRLYGREHDVSNTLQAAIGQVVERIHAETQRRLGQGAELERILFVGGGVVVLAEHLRNWFPNQAIAPQPAFANARGMLKYLQHVCEVPGS